MTRRSPLCGGISRSRECAATSSTLYFRCTRLSDGGCLATHTPGPPFGRGPDRPRRKTAAAVRADIVQLVLDAIRAERAFIGTDPRVRRVRRQVLVAIFAVRPELQRHGRLSMLIQGGSSQIASRNANDEFPSIWAMANYRVNSFSGSFELSFSRSSTIDERTCATLWCGISTLLTISDRLLRSRSTTFSR